MEDQTDVILCECKSANHTILFIKDIEPETNERTIYMYPRLNNFSFFERLRRGLKYIFGGENAQSEYEEFIFTQEHAKKFQKIADFLK